MKRDAVSIIEFNSSTLSSDDAKRKLPVLWYSTVSPSSCSNCEITSTVFLAKGIFNNKPRSSHLDWGVNNSVNYKNIPVIDLKKVHPIDKETLINVLDPITAFINVIEAISSKNKCDTSFKIFDGRRRYNLKTKTLGNSFIENDRPKSFKGDVLICGLKILPLGGHRLKTKWKPTEDKFTDFKLFFGRTNSGQILPVRMNLERWFGTVTVRLIEKHS